MEKKTIYESVLSKGYTRRDFLKICAMLGATIGLDYTTNDQVVHALENKKRVPVIWLQFQDCTGCSESFIRSSHPRVESVLFDLITLEYTEALSAAAGFQAEEAKENVIKNYPGEYILIVEGSIPTIEGMTNVAGKSAVEELKHAASGAKAILAYGSCSSWGGIAAAYPNPTKAKPITHFIKDKPVIMVPGCPPIAEVMTGIIAHIITFDKLPELDHMGRPKAFYRHRIHDKCNRRAYFDAGLFVENFDDEGAKQGYCLYKVGCKGPTTYNSCAEMRWNGGISYPIQAGNPCIGCSEQDFWDNGPFYVRHSKIPGSQTTINPETVGAIATVATVAGVAAHATATTIAKKVNDKKQREDISNDESYRS